MGDQVELQQQQQTRVLLLNGQTIILQGDATDNSINDINTELLEQALQEATNNNATEDNQGSSVSLGQNDNLQPNLPSHSTTDTSTNIIEESHQNEGHLEVPDDANNFVAIFENENGETQTVQLTLEQAAALGFQVDHNNSSGKEENSLGEVKDTTQYSDNQNETISRVPQIPSTVATQQIMAPTRTTQQQQSSSILGSLLKPTSTPSTISLVPHYLGNAGSMSYAIKLQDSAPASGLSTEAMISTSSAIIPQNTSNITSNAYIKAQAIGMSTQPTTSLQNQKLTVPIANKNIGIIRQQQRSVVKLKAPITSTVAPTILRTTGNKTVIPKIQGTPASMANLSLSSAQPISSTASMVRVLNNPVASTSTSSQSSPTTCPSSKSVSSTISTTTTFIKPVDKNNVPKAATNATKPLGSSENPIQLVQHGQTFHSMQPLSQEQLKQIATVLQQKQLDTSRNSKNVLFDSTTNTRIIYRVVYPEDLALKKPSTSSASSSSNTTLKALGRGGGRKGRPPKSLAKATHGKKINSDEDDDQLMDTDLSKGEKEERKKVLPRTRSGRLSRPPRHMVKDYKRIHHLDFAEPDLDDSDGGYSDYRISDSETVPDSALEDMNNETINTSTETEIPAEAGVQIKRAMHSKFRCPTCQKMYLGNRRLARHFEAFPDHGSMDNIPKTPLPTPKKIEVPAQTESVDSMNGAPVVMRPVISSSRGRGRRRGNPLFMNPVERNEWRKSKLRELLNSYEPSLVAEVAGPLVAQSLDVWQLLLLRVSTSEEEHTRLAALLAEMSLLLDNARSSMSEILQPNSQAGDINDKLHTIEVSDEVVASALNISCGTYNILESLDRKLQWRPASIIASSCAAQISGSTPDLNITPNNTESEEPETKKARMWHENEEEEEETIREEENTGDKSFLDSTNESEKPSDTSMCSDTPLDDIVKAELTNLANKSGLDDFVAPPPAPPLPTSSSTTTTPVTTNTSDSLNSHTSEVDFVATPFPSSDTTANAPHYTSDIVMDIPTSTVSNTTVTVSSDSIPTTTSSVPSKHSESNNIQYQLSSSSRLDLSEGSIDVNLDSHLEETTHTIDFEAFSEEFNANTQS